MDDKIKKDNDAYDELLKSFSSSKNTFGSSEEIKNHGEIYFSVNSNGKNPNSTQKKTYLNNTTSGVRKTNSSKVTSKSNTPVKKDTSSSVRPANKKKKRKQRNNLQNSILAIVIVVVVFISAFLIKIPLMACVNDILAIDVSNTDFRVVLDKDMDSNGVIDELAKKDLISNPLFCKLFANLFNMYEKKIENKDGSITKKVIVYPAGTYFLNSGMGLEGMLYEIRTNGVDTNTVKITFPEGFSVNQIAEKLDDNGVCSAESFYSAMLSDEIFEKYEFLNSITDKQLRYRLLEGYLYPDTYEFYLGESPISVIERFLNNFEDKWSETYAAKAAELGYTVDEIITIATILEKEAFDAEQMPIIASILYNRLGSSSFPFINCDSTAQYIDNFKESLEQSGQYANYMKVYDTYQKTGLPVGPICCPGADAIHAALYPDSTDYYYFLHDKEGKIYLASTAEEHQRNMQYLD